MFSSLKVVLCFVSFIAPLVGPNGGTCEDIQTCLPCGKDESEIKGVACEMQENSRAARVNMGDGDVDMNFPVRERVNVSLWAVRSA